MYIPCTVAVADTVHAMVLLMCHTHYTHYTLTQPETLGLIDNTLLNKKLKTNVMDVHCILNAIFNGKQTRRASSMLTKQWRIQHRANPACAPPPYWCGIVLIMGHCHQWWHRLGVSWRRSRIRLFSMMIDCYTLPNFSNQ